VEDKITSCEIDFLTTIIDKMLSNRNFSAETIVSDTIAHCSRELPSNILKIKSKDILEKFNMALERLKDQSEEEIEYARKSTQLSDLKQHIKTIKALLILTNKRIHNINQGF